MSDTLRLSIHSAASPETVFRFLSDPVLFKQWMGAGAQLDDAAISVRYPTDNTARGRILESIAPRRLTFGWGYDNNDHGLAPDSTTVTIELTPTESGATVTLTHAGLNLAQQSEHTAGWTHYLGQLAAAAANLGYASALPSAVGKYIEAWNESDIAVRATLLEACWEDDAIFRDSMGVADSRTSLLHYISGAQKFVPGFRLELAGAPEQVHGYYRFSWLIRMPDGNVMGRGTNFGQLSAAGRLSSAIGFWEKA